MFERVGGVHGRTSFGHGTTRSRTEELMISTAARLTLSPPELTVLIGGLRVLGANYDGSSLGIFTERVGVLTNDFFVGVLGMDVEWTPVGTNRMRGNLKAKIARWGRRGIERRGRIWYLARIRS